jgi:hypothetical protein
LTREPSLGSHRPEPVALRRNDQGRGDEVPLLRHRNLVEEEGHLELFRIDHVTAEKPLGMRLLGFGLVRLVTSDRSEAHVLLWGLRDFEKLAEQIRDASLKERQRGGITAFAQV